MSTTLVPLPKQDCTRNPPEALLPLFRELDRHGPNLDIARLDSALRHLEVSPESLADAIKIDIGAYVRTLVRKTDNYEVLVMAWLPGQTSPIHDHRGSACAVRVVAGRGVEQKYVLDSAGLAVPTERTTFLPGTVACSVDADVHHFGNAASCPAPTTDILVTVHVYAPPLAPTRKYATESPRDDAWSI